MEDTIFCFTLKCLLCRKKKVETWGKRKRRCTLVFRSATTG